MNPEEPRMILAVIQTYNHQFEQIAFYCLSSCESKTENSLKNLGHRVF